MSPLQTDYLTIAGQRKYSTISETKKDPKPPEDIKII